MSTRALIRAIQHLFSHTSRLAQRITKKIVTGFLRNLLLVGRRPRTSKAGFVLPTTVLLLLVATLTVGSITYRTFTRTTQTIGDRQQRVIYNAATPAIDRARSKLEYLFNAQQDPRFPGGVPGETQLLGMLLNDERELPGGLIVPEHKPNDYDPYTFPDEDDDIPGITKINGRLDINGDSQADNAWAYRVDTNEDGEEDATVAYSIIFQTPNTAAGDAPLTNPSPQAIAARASDLQVRQGPLSLIDPQGQCQLAEANVLSPEGGWIPDGSSTSTLRKTFQIDSFVLPDDPNGTVTTLEFNQDRQVNRGNKWGAWFRYDLEIYPGASFNWNGAMHTEGNLIVGKPQGGIYRSFLISSPNSCLYTKEASEITIANTTENTQGLPPFLGQTLAGLTGTNVSRGESLFDVDNGGTPQPGQQLNPRTDSIDGEGEAVPPGAFALDPVKLLTKDTSEARVLDNSVADQDADWQDSVFVDKGRIRNASEPAPYVDDTFRADDRYGPKPRYQGEEFPANTKIGATIPPSETRLTGNTSNTDDNTGVGLDGYWERRARNEGARIVVGQRLELGNPFPTTWGVASDPDSEPMRPWKECSPNNAGRCYEARQRRTLRDNLAAVQATAVYHRSSPDIPLACVATTVHPGTSLTLDRGSTFENIFGDVTRRSSLVGGGIPLAVSDFFSGRGTNGWEYTAPTAADFSAGSPMMTALTNLAYFTGDPNGGAPSFTPVQNDGEVHPQPTMTMWGDFSMLRRIIDTGDAYDSLSLADRTTYHTAACTLGMLAHNINYLVRFEPSPGDITLLTDVLNRLSSGNTGNSGIRMAAPPNGPGFPPEAYVEGLKKWRNSTTPNYDPVQLDSAIALAQLIMEKEQVARDRAFGFSPATVNTCPTRLGSLRGLCPSQPKYPILFSIFPGDYNSDTVLSSDDNHPELGAQSRGEVEPTDEAYIDGENGAYSYQYVDVDTPPATNLHIARVVRPKRIEEGWVLQPEQIAGVTGAYTNSNEEGRIKVCVDGVCLGRNDGTLYRVLMKDSSLFNGREMMSVRVLDLNLDLMRKASVGTGDFWLPTSGLIYAFREDAVAENMIVRPPSADWTICNTNASYEDEVNACHMQRLEEAASLGTDPPVSDELSISPKPVDYYPDPDRRPHGFRFRKGSFLGRNGDEGRGLSFITDNTVYIQGNFNLHQANEGAGQPLEEFLDILRPDFNNFYGRDRLNVDFARSLTDVWRPTEILADAVTILSDNFCDGSIEDGILSAGSSNNPDLNALLTAARPGGGAASYGCTTDAGGRLRTSYLNQNRPNPSPAIAQSFYRGIGTGLGLPRQRWLRENPYDLGSPIAISRKGNPKIVAGGTPMGTEYESGYYTFDQNKPLISARDGARVNSIIVSGILPSRPGQGYGGMHNFPRLLENWEDRSLFISGAFLQLNFSNYATGPYDQDAFEVGDSSSVDVENLKYYEPPNRRWGYDVGLQYAPAGPVARRFVTATSVRSEFYNEPPANDPYIANLCKAINDRCPE
ncbi:hypothetical protein H6F93_17365 [Leptolyngbya sp. FACHB-671]|uniref:hormogonium polysaccharide biosynthesis protein HpsA n=1 Tax=Leptolyngbya sp. FACHB-671 TaxID=2692812 RepID=UPI00168724BD|nr:hormogonium polysaccharide biosynthesis protein HpsA [Leptolyngbya sp. FACHB-671]MBD1871134.1 hypothetical protein [Cyanobacteria bacterium FACHB-471]MBD2069264.1 hypothetical protein [Leptolyngbya sp. FACHB-671]